MNKIIVYLSLLMMVAFQLMAQDAFQKMIDAIEQNDQQTVQFLLKQGLNPNQRIDTRAAPTFLTHAASLGRNEIIKTLVKSGANIHDQDGDGETPLINAGRNGHLSTIKLLLTLGANPTDMSSRRDTLLSVLPTGKYQAVIQMLRSIDKKNLYQANQLIMQDTVRRHLKLGESDKLAQVMKLYADQVDYYKNGLVTANFIQKDKQQFFERWPTRRYTLLPSFVALPLKKGYKVYFRYEYYIKNQQKKLKGHAWNELEINLINNLPLITSEKGGAIPSLKKIIRVFKTKEPYSIEDIVPINLAGNEKAFYLPVRFTNRGRCCEISGVLFRPSLNRAREIKMGFLHVKSFDLDGDGISELELEGGHSGQGYSEGRRKLGYFHGWKFIEILSSGFSDNLGTCQSDEDMAKVSENECSSNYIDWEYVDLNNDNILDIRQIRTVSIWTWEKEIKNEQIEKEFIFRNRKVIENKPVTDNQ